MAPCGPWKNENVKKWGLMYFDDPTRGWQWWENENWRKD